MAPGTTFHPSCVSLANRTKIHIWWWWRGERLLTKVTLHARGRFASSVTRLVDCALGPVSAPTGVRERSAQDCLFMLASQVSGARALHARALKVS